MITATAATPVSRFPALAVPGHPAAPAFGVSPHVQTLGFSSGSVSGGGPFRMSGNVLVYGLAGAVLGCFLPIPLGPVGGAIAGVLIAKYAR